VSFPKDARLSFTPVNAFSNFRGLASEVATVPSYCGNSPPFPNLTMTQNYFDLLSLRKGPEICLSDRETGPWSVGLLAFYTNG